MDKSPLKQPAVLIRAFGHLLVHPLKPGENPQAYIDNMMAMPHVDRIEMCHTLPTRWRTSNSMDMATGNTAFDRKRVVAMTGNIISDTMYGTFIRPRQEIECNGFVSAPGHLQAFDLKGFSELRPVRDFVERDVRFETTTCIGYAIFHWDGEHRIYHGALVTDKEHQLLRQFDRRDLGLPYRRTSDAVMSAMRFRLTDECLMDRTPVWQRH